MTDDRRIFLAFLPALLCIAMVFLITGASLATLPLYIHIQLGYSASVVGMVAAAQFVAAIISRVWAGRMADQKGPKSAMIVGLAFTFAAGAFYLGSALLAATPSTALIILIGARILLGGAESFIITSCQSWGLALSGRDRAAEVIGRVGVALYLSLALGGPFGSVIYATAGFGGIAMLTLLVPVGAVALVLPRPGPAPIAKTATKGQMVLAAVARAGVAAGLAGFAYSALAFFSVLLFLDRGWQPTWAPFSVFAVALILMRLVFPRLPDQIGARKTALIFLFVQMVGLASVIQGSFKVLALAGCFVAGIGYAFIYPALGREAVQSVPPERVGLALGYYSAFFDLSMGASGLLLGQVADHFGLWAVILAAILASALAAGLVSTLQRRGIG